MFIELVDALRCPVPHEESWLVLSATLMRDRHAMDGTLGCPVCHAEYPIADGIVNFRRTAVVAHGDVTGAQPRAAPDDDALRLAALLGLDDALGFAVLCGAWGRNAEALRHIIQAPLVLVDPPGDVKAAPGRSLLLTDGPLPLASGAARAVAMDGGSAERIASVVRATRPGGRVVGPVSCARPDGVRELARDEHVWVGEREAAASPLVTLHVRRGGGS